MTTIKQIAKNVVTVPAYVCMIASGISTAFLWGWGPNYILTPPLAGITLVACGILKAQKYHYEHQQNGNNVSLYLSQNSAKRLDIALSILKAEGLGLVPVAGGFLALNCLSEKFGWN